MACVYVYVIILALVGPEKLGHKFGVAHDNDLADAAGTEALNTVVHQRESMGHDLEEGSSDGDVGTGKGSRLEKEVAT